MEQVGSHHRQATGLLTRNSVLSHVQDLFQDRLVAFLGSGSSAPYGLPTMAELCDDLLNRLDNPEGTLSGFDEFKAFRDRLAVHRNLEADLSLIEDDEFLTALKNSIADCIGLKEREAFGLALAEPMHLELLVSQALKVPSRFSIVTTNYDRLAEFSAEKAGYPVNSSFVGSYCGVHDPKACRSMQLTQKFVPSRRKTRIAEAKHVAMFKPHGSLGWFDVNGKVHESSFPLSFPRKVIAPTEGKFQEGYEEIYTFHRNGANDAIRNASALIVVGYGFWDGHLHQTLVNSIRSGVPTLILTRGVRQYVEELARTSPNCLLMGQWRDSETRCIQLDKPELFLEECLWDLRVLLQESFSLKIEA